MAENEQEKAEREERELYESVSAEIYGQQEVTETVAAEAPMEPVITEAKPEVADPWAGVSPGLRQMMEGINSRMADLDQINDRLKQAERRVGSLNNKLAAAPVMPKAPTAEEIAQAAESDEKLQEFLRDFPVHAEGIQALINKRLQSQPTAGIPVEEIEAIRAELQTDFDKKLDTAQKGFELKLLKSKYKNHVQIATSPEFMSWMDEQDDELKQKAGGWNALDGIEVLDKFFESRKAKDDLPDITGEREARLNSAAADTRTNRSKPVRQKTVAEMSEAELYEYEAGRIWRNK